LSFGINTPGLIIIRPPLPDSSDILFTICQLGLCFGLIVAICVRITCNVDTFQSFFLKTNEEKKEKRRIPISMVAILIPFLLSLAISQDFLPIISFIISLLCPYFMFIAPGFVISIIEY